MIQPLARAEIHSLSFQPEDEKVFYLLCLYPYQEGGRLRTVDDDALHANYGLFFDLGRMHGARVEAEIARLREVGTFSFETAAQVRGLLFGD